MKSYQLLDGIVRDAMKHFEAPFDPTAWDKMAQALDAAPASGEELFDSLVSGQLAGLTVAAAPGWDEMERLLEAEEAAQLIEEEAVIDNAVSEKLQNFHAPYEAQHWNLMAKRLEEEFSILHKLYKYKVAEVGIMLLLLLTIIRFYPLAEGVFDNGPKNGNAPAQQSQPTVPAAPQLLIPQGQPSEMPSNQKVEIAPGTPIAALEPQSGQAISSSENASGQATKVGFGEENGVGTKNIPSQNATNAPLKAGVSEKNIATATKAVSKNTAEKPLESAALAQTGNDGQEVSRPLSPSENGAASLAALPLLEAKAIASDEQSPLHEMLAERRFLQNTLPAPSTEKPATSTELLAALDIMPVKSGFAWELPTLKTIPVVKRKEIRFSIVTASDLNYVLTPPDKLSVFDTIVMTDADTTAASGYGAGLLVNLKKGKWEVQTGGIYSFKRYIPNTPAFLFQTVNYYINEDFHGIQLDILQVPLNVNYHFKNSGKWRFYGMAGFSGHFITSSLYEIRYKRVPVFKASVPSGAEGNERADNSSIRQEKEFPKGLFDGGNIRDNFYMTANIGLGVERFFNPRWSVFCQPNYQHYLNSNGIGTNKDKIYSLSFYLGTKVTLK